MIPLEKQVVSLELAKKLKELGVKQKSIFYWSKDKERKEFSLDMGTPSGVYWDGVWMGYRVSEEEKKTAKPCPIYSAFTVAELGEMFPVSVELQEETCWFDCTKTKFKYRCGYTWDHSGEVGWGRYSDAVPHAVGVADTEADARAKMLIYLIENKLV